MKPEQNTFPRVPTILFLITGVFWVGMIAIGGGLVLVWAALTCFASVAFLVMWEPSWVTRPLVVASSIFGVVVTLYQVYAGLTSVGTKVESLALYSVPLFVVFTLIYLYLVYDTVFAGRKTPA